ncbi:MAG: hypothetical protein GY719_09725 [bacterium]|nr:hypothetical protein [bacterium]
MNTKQYAKIAAVAIGAMLILNAVTILTRILTDPRTTLDWSDWAFAMVPLLLAILLATLIYRYTRSLDFDDSVPSSINLLEAGIKLLGAYWIVSAIPHSILAIYLIVRRSMSASGSFGSAEIINPLVYGLVYGLAGYFFVRRTGTIKKLVGASDGA